MRFAALAVIAGLAFGQETPPVKSGPAVLQNTGKPMLVPFQCTEDDVVAAGLSCTEEAPCPVYLELDAVAAVGDRLFAVGNLHSAAVTLYSTLLASDDNGQTWHEAAERVRGAGLDRVQFLDADNGWASGEKLSPLPQEPFLMRTTDGGKSWRLRPVFGESAENKLGAIQQFLFTEKDSGTLIIDRGQGADGDRYELYESPDGGASWSFRQSSTKPLTLRRAPAVSTEWRVRADSRTHAFHIEHRSGEKWTSVAAFSVSIGACKP